MTRNDPPYASPDTVADRAREAWRPVPRKTTDRVAAGRSPRSAPLAPAKARLAALVREVQRDATTAVLQYVPAVIAGAAEELRVRGLPATPAAVARTLELEGSGGRVALDLVDRMIRHLVGEGPVTVLARARRLGVEAVCSAVDGVGDDEE